MGNMSLIFNKLAKVTQLFSRARCRSPEVRSWLPWISIHDWSCKAWHYLRDMDKVHPNPRLFFRGAWNVTINYLAFCIKHCPLLVGLILQGMNVKKKKCIHLTLWCIRPRKSWEIEERIHKKRGGGKRKHPSRLYLRRHFSMNKTCEEDEK